MSPFTLLAIVTAWTFVGLALALVIGRVIARADLEASRVAGATTDPVPSDVFIPAPRSAAEPLAPAQAGAAGAER